MSAIFKKQNIVIFTLGAISIYIWLWLLGIWASYDTGFSFALIWLGFNPVFVSYISLFLFCILLALSFIYILQKVFFGSSLEVNLVFILGFVAAHILSTILSNGISFIFSSIAIWLFLATYLCCIFLKYGFKSLTHHSSGTR